MNNKLISATLALGLLMPAYSYAQNWKNEAHDAWLDGKAESVLLLNTNLNNFDINTEVHQGKVILTGEVDSDVDKALAGELVEGLQGVTSVDNKLTVMPASPTKRDDNADDAAQMLTDTKITTVVKTRLLFEPEVSGTAINVTTEDGVVSLDGELHSSAEKDLALNIARNTDDVKNVVDNLRVLD